MHSPGQHRWTTTHDSLGRLNKSRRSNISLVIRWKGPDYHKASLPSSMCVYAFRSFNIYWRLLAIATISPEWRTYPVNFVSGQEITLHPSLYEAAQPMDLLRWTSMRDPSPPDCWGTGSIISITVNCAIDIRTNSTVASYSTCHLKGWLNCER